MTTSKSNKVMLTCILSIILFGCQKKNLFNNNNLNNSLNLTIKQIISKEPECKFITVFVTESNERVYMFVQSEKSLHDVKSCYYIKDTGYTIILVYDNKELESKYANMEMKQNFLTFQNKSKFDFYENQVYSYELLPSFNVKKMSNYDENLRRLNKLNRINFIEPLK